MLEWTTIVRTVIIGACDIKIEQKGNEYRLVNLVTTDADRVYEEYESLCRAEIWKAMENER